MKTILVIQPGFPAEAPFYVRGLARMGARVLGVGDQPQAGLPKEAKEGLAAYLRIPRLWHPPSLIDSLRRWDLPLSLDGVECLWEPAMEISAEVRRAFGLPGLSPESTRLFRDKHSMRQALEKAGIRNPRYRRAAHWREVLAGAEEVGFPLIIKPVDGAGSARTHRIENARELEAVKADFAAIPEVVLEEFIEGNEYTFDTLSSGGKILFNSVLRYRPTMLESRTKEWISPQNMVLRDLSSPLYQRAYDLGQKVIEALGFDRGITHMEWFEKADGEVVFGEIAARPPGGFTGELINYSCDIDFYNLWAETVLTGEISSKIERKYNVAMIFKRAEGRGKIHRVEGLRDLYRRFGEHIVRQDLLPIGANRRDWRQTLLSDGFMILRHPNLERATEMSEYVAHNLRLHAR